MNEAIYVPVQVKRAIVNEMADWLEHRHFKATVTGPVDIETAEAIAHGWAEGYRRAIYELRWAAAEPVQIPDDISEIE